jgi:hypothetical protein
MAATFPSVACAAQAAVSAQVALFAAEWPPDAELRVRMGIHAGDATERDNDYFGATVNRAARLMGAGHGGQILLSGAAHGMWLPQFMLPEKRAMHMAQGPGNINYQGQSPYPIYFAGNNLTADSLEHAFLSGAIIADYAFGAPLPVIDNIPAALMYELFKDEFMFPTGTSAGAATPDVSARQAEILLHALTSPT